jgi:hypothetical protein
MSGLDALAESVAENKGVLTVKMEQLRDASGFQRLGGRVAERIAEKLALKGLKHFPRKLSAKNKEALVRLYDPRTPAGAFIVAVLSPGAANDEKILGVSANSATVTLAKIREVLEEADA